MRRTSVTKPAAPRSPAPSRRATVKLTDVSKQPADVNATTEPKFVTIKGAAAFSTLSEVGIRRMLTRKQLTRYKCGSRTLIKLSELVALIHPA